MIFNIPAVNEADGSSLAASVQSSPSLAGKNDDKRHGARSPRPQVEARLREATSNVLRGTGELFPGDVSIDEVDDPEIPQSRYLAVSCQSNRSVEEIMVAFNQWHAKLTLWAPGLEHLFRLSIDAIE